MSTLEWLDDNRIKVEPPNHPKKITGTRLATILGLNTWATPFEAWCEITRTYQEPFIPTQYTKAGKAIEPNQIKYIQKAYFMSNIVTPESVYGEDYFKQTWGDFYPENPIFGGMWDSLAYNEDDLLDTVLEFKTTKRAEDWAQDIPEYYALQAALYAFLLGVDDVIMVVSFLQDNDYAIPEKFQPSANNTAVFPFKVSERYGDFSTVIQEATDWWNKHVVTGTSPPYDERKDKDILKELRTRNISPDTDIQDLLKEADALKVQLEELAEPLKPVDKRLKTLTGILREYTESKFREGDTKVTYDSDVFEWNVSKIQSIEVDKDALTRDGLLDKYTTVKTSYRVTTKRKE